MAVPAGDRRLGRLLNECHHSSILYRVSRECSAETTMGLAVDLLEGIGTGGPAFVDRKEDEGARPQDIAFEVLRKWCRENPRGSYARTLQDVLEIVDPAMALKMSALLFPESAQEDTSMEFCNDEDVYAEDAWSGESDTPYPFQVLPQECLRETAKTGGRTTWLSDASDTPNGSYRSKKRQSQVDEDMSGQPLLKRHQTRFVRKDTKPGRLLKKKMHRQSSSSLSLKKATSKKARKRKKKVPVSDPERMDIGSAVEFTYRQPLDDMEHITEEDEPFKTKGGTCTCIGECTVKVSCFDKTLKEVGIFVSEEAFNDLRLLPLDKFKSLCQNVLRMNIDHFTFENKDNLDPVVAPNAECLSVLTVHGRLDDYGTKTQRRKLKRRFAKYLSELLDHDDAEQVKVRMVASGCIMFFFTMTAANTEHLMHVWKTEPEMVQQGFCGFTSDHPQPVIDVSTTIGLKQHHSIQTQIQRETSTPEPDLQTCRIDDCTAQDTRMQEESAEDDGDYETCSINGCTSAQEKKLQEESAEDDKESDTYPILNFSTMYKETNLGAAGFDDFMRYLHRRDDLMKHLGISPSFAYGFAGKSPLCHTVLGEDEKSPALRRLVEQVKMFAPLSAASVGLNLNAPTGEEYVAFRERIKLMELSMRRMTRPGEEKKKEEKEEVQMCGRYAGKSRRAARFIFKECLPGRQDITCGLKWRWNSDNTRLDCFWMAGTQSVLIMTVVIHPAMLRCITSSHQSMELQPAVEAAEQAVNSYNDCNELSLHLCLNSAEEADIAARIRSQSPHFSPLDIVYKLLDVWLAQTTMTPPQ